MKQLSVSVTKNLSDVLEHQREKYIAVHGHEPGPEDALFFDLLDEDLVDYQLIDTLRECLPPEYVYAVRNTGWLLTEDNIEFAPPAIIDTWNTSVESFRSR